MTTIADPLQLPCGATLPNRLAKAAMTEGLADPYNRATARHVELYRRWANGAGMLLTGNVQIDRRHLERPGNVVIAEEPSAEARAALERWAEAASAGGAHLWMQISHAGRQTPDTVNSEPSAPSAVALALPTGFGAPRAMTEEEIEDVIEGFARAARVAKECGFHGVQVHSAHGYLLSEFLSPLVNRREDRWGGSLENRARLLMEVLRRTRDAVGPRFPVSVKLNSSDFQQGGFSHEECLELVSWLDQTGLDLLEISGGNYEQPSMMGAGGVESEPSVRVSTRAREAYFLCYAASVRDVTRVPLMVTGGFRSRSAMDAALGEGAADLIGLARPMCFDPDVPRKLLEGSMEQTPRWENRMRLGPGPFGPRSRFRFIRSLNGWGVQGSFCLQLLRMGDGQDPEKKPSALKGLVGYQRNETATAKAWKEAMKDG